MDLNAANAANGRIDRITRAGMVICFLLASGTLLASLAFAHAQSSVQSDVPKASAGPHRIIAHN